MKAYVVATVKDWNIESFNELSKFLPGSWTLITSKEELTVERLTKIEPDFVFFPHWNWVVSDEILERWDCVCFHMTDVPYGRGGSPLQNLIIRGHSATKLTALRMVRELDAGPVYKKVNLSLEGSAQEIFERTSRRIYDLIRDIILTNPTPVPQAGEVTPFSRRNPTDSELPAQADLKCVYDHIRMLDAESYPKAFIKHGALRIEFENARWDSAAEEVVASVKITLGDK
jgi:methionyl-tRNA formyltransferase